jgi:hypothetical protein
MCFVKFMFHTFYSFWLLLSFANHDYLIGCIPLIKIIKIIKFTTVLDTLENFGIRWKLNDSHHHRTFVTEHFVFYNVSLASQTGI